jgi:hypothetical protein
MIVEIGRACGSDCDLFRAHRSRRQQRAHPAERLDHFVMRVGARIQDRFSFARGFASNFRFRLAYPVRNVPRAGNPGDRNDLTQPAEQRPPTRRHFAMAVNLDRTSTAFAWAMRARVGPDLAAVSCAVAAGPRLLLRDCAAIGQARVLLAGEIDSRIPNLFEGADRGAHHAGQVLDRFHFTELDARKRLAHGNFQIVGINRPQQPAGQSRGELTHGENLHPILAGARGMNTCHVPGEFRVHYDGMT